MKAGDLMSTSLILCEEGTDIGEAAKMMEDHMIRRLLVTGDNKEIVGVLSLGDLAEHARKSLAVEVIKEISIPSEPER